MIRLLGVSAKKNRGTTEGAFLCSIMMRKRRDAGRPE